MFDGGCIPNPGRKYGSWMIEVNGQECTRRERIDFGQGTNNEAEFEALESALRFSLDNLPLAGLNPRDFSVFLETDSTIVRNRIAQKGGRVPKEGHKPALTKLRKANSDKIKREGEVRLWKANG